jgi:hypothetical protein
MPGGAHEPDLGRSVTDMAFGWGFNSVATFFRAFRQADG